MTKSTADKPKKPTRKKRAVKSVPRKVSVQDPDFRPPLKLPDHEIRRMKPLSDEEIARRVALANAAPTAIEALQHLVGILAGPDAMTGDEVMHYVRDGGE